MEHGDLIVSTYIRKCLDNGEQFDTNILLGGQPTNDTDSEITLLPDEDKSDNDNDKSNKEAISANSMIDVLVAFLECLPDP